MKPDVFVIYTLLSVQLTYVGRSSASSLRNDAALQPVTISRSTTPKLYTSDFAEYDLRWNNSGALYDLSIIPFMH